MKHPLKSMFFKGLIVLFALYSLSRVVNFATDLSRNKDFFLPLYLPIYAARDLASSGKTLAFVVICCSRCCLCMKTRSGLCVTGFTLVPRKYICAYIRSESLSMSTMSEMGRLNFSQEGPACV